MGYHTPSPEEVYRRAFRLDGPATLTDRFGFSIVLINDHSPLCREFLLRYCLDLSLRTADRIRFIFFSELRFGEFYALAGGGRRPNGLLRRVLATFGGRLNAEQEPWSDLRPRELWPLADADAVEEVLSFECEQGTAMPGVGAAMQFAHRLGVGALVPCVVAFSEVGATHVHVLPIEGMAPETIFRHVRGWIDEFYAENRAGIERWQRVENEIERLATEIEQPLATIRAWRNAQLSLWSELKAASVAIRLLESGSAIGFESLIDGENFSISMRVRATLAPLRDIDQRRRKAEAALCSVEAARSALRAADDFDTVRAALSVARNELSHTRRPPALVAAIERLDALRASPRADVNHWWKTSHASFPLSGSRHSSARRAWRERASALKVYNRVERRALVEELRECALATPPEDVANHVLAPLALALAMDPGDAAFRALTSAFRADIEKYARNVVDAAPLWLLKVAPGLTYGEALPLNEDWHRAAIDGEGRGTLSAAVETATQSGPELRARFASESKQLVIEELDDLSKQLRAGMPDEDAARTEAITLLQPLRRRLAEETVAASAEIEPLPAPPPLGRLVELHRALDEYQSAVGAIVFPYVEDPRTVRVDVAMPLVHAAEIEPRPRSQPDHDSTLKWAASAGERWEEALTAAEREVTANSPLGRIAEALDTEEDAWKALTSLTPDSVPARAAKVVEALSAAERHRMAAVLDCRPETDDILTAMGLYAGDYATASSRLAQQVSKDRFDVFMAHNSLDKPAVLSVAATLRQRGLYPWIDVEQIPPGRWFQDALQVAIPRCRTAAIFIGPKGLGQWQKLELRTFISRCIEDDMPVIPVLLPGVDALPSSLVFLRELNMVKFRRGLHEADTIDRLVWGITGVVPGQTASG